MPARRTRVERGIYRSSSRSLEIGWTDASGKQCFRAVSGGIKAARAARAEELAKKARGEAPADNRLRFDRAAEEWESTRQVAERTRLAYGFALKHLRARFGRTKLAAIGVGDVARYVAARKAAGAKGWTIRKELSCLSAVFKYAARLGYSGVNPVQLLDHSERPDTRDAKDKRILTPEESDRLLAGMDAPYRLLFELAAESGARLGETLGLTWADVDTEGGTLRLDRQLDRHGERVPLKTARSRRTIEITPALSAKLAAAKLASPQSQPADLVFLSRRGTPHDHRNIMRVLSRVAERAALDAPAPSFHDLRHTHASRLIAAGMDVQSVADRLGHASIAITQSTYAHQFDAANRSGERRALLESIYSGGDGRPMVGTGGNTGQQEAVSEGAAVVDLRPEAAGGGGRQ